jgi:hypothetical protein
MAIKKIKVASVFIEDEKEITAKTGKKYKLCGVSIKSADDCPNYAGKWIKTTIFEYVDPKDSKKNKTATEKAEYFKTNSVDKEILVDVTETEWSKDDKSGVNLLFKTLTKAQAEVAKQFIK